MKIKVINPSKKSKTKVKSTMKRKRVVKRKRRKTAIKRINPVAKRRKRRVIKKSNPKRSHAVMKKRRKRRTAVKKVYKRRLKRNPSKVNFDFMDVIVNGGIAGAGAFAALWLSNKLNTIFDKYTGGTPIARNGLALGVAVGGSYLGYKFLDKKKAEALSAGMVAGIVLLMVKSNFGASLGLAGDAYENPLENYTLGYVDSGMGLLEEGQSSGSLGLLSGRYEDEYGMNEYM